MTRNDIDKTQKLPSVTAKQSNFLYEFRIRRHRRTFANEGKVNGPECVYRYLQHLAVGLDRENFYAVHLNIRGAVLGYEVVAVGGLDAVEVAPRELFRAAILSGAAAIILAHNHPSGETKHSSADLELVKRMKAAGEILGIEVLDSIVLGEHGYSSLTNETVGGGS